MAHAGCRETLSFHPGRSRHFDIGDCDIDLAGLTQVDIHGAKVQTNKISAFLEPPLGQARQARQQDVADKRNGESRHEKRREHAWKLEG